MHKISIIIPVYNAERTIGKCIDSIVQQTFQDFELIIVNDGSKDHSLEICEEYITRDKRITILTQENCGVSIARNHGIEHSKGKWIVFIDSDDYVDPEYLEQLYRHASDKENTLIIQGFKCLNENCIRNIELGKDTLIGVEIQTAFNEKRIFEYGYPFAKLYNRNVVHNFNIRFNNHISYAEDLLFMLEYILHCDSIEFIDGSNYNYVINTSGLSQRYNSFESEYRLFKKYDKLNNEVAQKFSFEPTESSLRNGALLLMRSLYSIYINKEMAKRERLNTINSIKMKYHNYIKEYYKPQILLFRLIKSAFFMHPLVFDTICRIKFR